MSFGLNGLEEASASSYGSCTPGLLLCGNLSLAGKGMENFLEYFGNFVQLESLLWPVGPCSCVGLAEAAVAFWGAQTQLQVVSSFPVDAGEFYFVAG